MNNTRDLGGFPIDLNSSTKFGAFIRSDVPINLLKEEMDFFVNMKITTIIDLRTKSETIEYPCAFKGNPNFSYFNFSVAKEGNLPDKEEDIPMSYFGMVHENENIYHVMKTIADSEGGVLFHCMAGKDRTGIVAALLLSLVGVQMCDILADYEVTYCYIREVINKELINDPMLPAFMGQSKLDYMENFLKIFYENYHSTEKYLLKIGLTKEEINKIKIKLINNN